MMGRELALSLRRAGTWAGLVYVPMAFCAFAFALGPEALPGVAAPLLLAVSLLAILLALPGLFESDEEDGTLEQYLLLPQPLEMLALVKLVSFYITAALPLCLLAPLLAFAAGGDGRALFEVLLPATALLSETGLVLAALTLGLKRSGLLHAVLLLPLATPVLIFAASGHVLLLSGAALVLLPVSCWAAAGLLRLGGE